MTDLTNGNCWHCGKKVTNIGLRDPHTCDFYFYCNAECKAAKQKEDLEKRLLTIQSHHSRYEHLPKFFGKESLESNSVATKQPVVEVSTIGEEVTDTNKKNKKRGRKKKKSDQQ